MSVKIASILVPVYIRPNHQGQTPEPYGQTIVERWERELVARVNGVVQHKPTQQLFPDHANGGVVRKTVVRYDFEVDTTEPALAEVIALALSIFNVKMVTVLLDDTEAEDFDMDAAEALSIGAHDWSNRDDA
jgi:hypothetical protein